MAEYINREELFHQGEWMYDTKAECEADALRYVVKMDTINLMTPVDVVERAEYDKMVQSFRNGIDKAIEEMDNIDLNEYADNTYQLVNKCIEILKRNIGK